jgi:hypothetical protein
LLHASDDGCNSWAGRTTHDGSQVASGVTHCVRFTAESALAGSERRITHFSRLPALPSL